MMDDIEKAKHQGELQRWQALYDSALHSDRIAAEIGIFVLKIVLLMNGASLAALLTALTQLKDRPVMVGVIAEAAKLFFWGFMAAALAAGLSYFYQSFITAKDWHEFHKAYPTPDVTPPFAWARTSAAVLIIVIILLALCSYGIFGLGAWNLIGQIPGAMK